MCMSCLYLSIARFPSLRMYESNDLEIRVVFVRERHGSGVLHLLLVFGHGGLVDLDLWWSKGNAGDEVLSHISVLWLRQQTRKNMSTHQRLVTDQLPCEPEERLLEVVVGLGRDVVVLQVLLAVEGDGLGLDLALLDVDLVAGEHDGHVLAHAHQVAVPVGHVLVGDARGHVEHDDAALAVDVVAVAQPAELLLASRVPDIELDLAEVLWVVC